MTFYKIYNVPLFLCFYLLRVLDVLHCISPISNEEPYQIKPLNVLIPEGKQRKKPQDNEDMLIIMVE